MSIPLITSLVYSGAARLSRRFDTSTTTSSRCTRRSESPNASHVVTSFDTRLERSLRDARHARIHSTPSRHRPNLVWSYSRMYSFCAKLTATSSRFMLWSTIARHCISSCASSWPCGRDVSGEPESCECCITTCSALLMHDAHFSSVSRRSPCACPAGCCCFIAMPCPRFTWFGTLWLKASSAGSWGPCGSLTRGSLAKSSYTLRWCGWSPPSRFGRSTSGRKRM
mmetsp:Transcript_52268/g.123756  ORF Transcript_52268/g.123756 Transcript_52268/m.123756 type:complete len:225 (-) Transcript_52268:566-1240(-)